METEENKDLVRRFYQEAIRERDAGTGRRVEFTSTAVLRVRDGLIVQAWDEMDSGGILKKLVG